MQSEWTHGHTKERTDEIRQQFLILNGMSSISVS